MKDDRITAMWEEDGDLMRLKEFFAYIHQNDNLKERVKNKTLEKITADKNSLTLVQTLEDSEEQTTLNVDQTKPEMVSREKTIKEDRKSKWNRIKEKLLRKNTLKGLSAAAVVVFAVYLGSTGMLMGSNTPFGLSKAKTSDTASQEAGFGDNGYAPAPATPNPTFASKSLAKGEIMDQIASTYEMDGRNALTKENAIAGASPVEAVEQKIDPKIIYVLDVSLKTDNVPATVKSVEEKVRSLGGYIAESRQNNEENHTNAFLSLRIPVAQYESFRGDLSAFGTVASEHLFTDDVSRQYFDVETRLRSWEAQEKRYLEILQQAKTVEDILRIEDSLANVRREMESLKGQLKYWDNRVQYSEIRMNIYPNQSNLRVNDPWQPVSLTSTIQAAKNAVIKTVSFIWNSINYVIVFIGYAIPLAIIMVIAWLAYLKFSKK